MITSEKEYEQSIAEIKNLTAQYKNLSEFDRKKPYIGQQMARDISRLTSDAKVWEYDRFEKSFKLVPDKR